jgi:hypothetical protein
MWPPAGPPSRCRPSPPAQYHRRCEMRRQGWGRDRDIMRAHQDGVHHACCRRPHIHRHLVRLNLGQHLIHRHAVTWHAPRLSDMHPDALCGSGGVGPLRPQRTWLLEHHCDGALRHGLPHGWHHNVTACVGVGQPSSVPCVSEQQSGTAVRGAATAHVGSRTCTTAAAPPRRHRRTGPPSRGTGR